MTGKTRKDHRFDICRELCELIAPFAQSKHLKSENDFNINKSGKQNSFNFLFFKFVTYLKKI